MALLGGNPPPPTFSFVRLTKNALAEGIRLNVFKNYVILYVIEDGVLEIRRIVHGARELANLD